MEPAPLEPPGTTGPAAGDEGYRKVLANRQIQMIAFGGAIGVGLFLGTAAGLQSAGPGLVFAYAIAGVAAFLVMRALGELVLHRPTSGSFVTYAREFIGPWAGFASGWMYWMNWAMTGVAELTAVGIYVHYWLPGMPQWSSALLALAALLTVNVVSVRLFGELEFWFALFKVAAIVVFLAVGLVVVATGATVGPYQAGWANISEHGGFFPEGLGVVVLSLHAVVFAYSSIELVGIAAGETADPRTVLPKAINAVVWRIAVFYVGSVALLVVVLPWTAYHTGESPFVTVFAMLGVAGAGGIMNFVVLSAALSSTNSGLYSTGRILRSLACRGEAPRFAGRISHTGVPYGGIVLTSAVYLAGVVLNLAVPSHAFEVATSLAALGVLTTWATILYCQVRLKAAADRGELERPWFRMPWSPWSNYAGLAFLALILVLMCFDAEQRRVVAAVPGFAVALWIGWRVVRARRTVRRTPGSARPRRRPR